MKLIFCPKCHDVVRLFEFKRHCFCRKSWGAYEGIENALNATYGGEAIPLGFANSTLADALRNQPEEGLGKYFTAFVIPKECDTFKKGD